MPNIIETLATRLSHHQVIPFFGAGCSIDALNVDWDKLCQLMDKETGGTSTDNAASASAYVNKFGKEKFCDFLRGHLIVDTVSDEQTENYIFLLGLSFLSVYTTNQDNVFEKVIEGYEDKYNIVYDINTIATIVPKHRTLYKFHGDLKAPDTIVYTTEDYDGRMVATANPMDIRLRSDALARSLLFIGYSFKDPNVQLLFRNLHELFGHALPDPYLIQRVPNDTFAKKLKDEYGITAINCMEEMPGAKDDKDAFGQFLKKLADATISMRTSNELSELFKPSVPTGRRVLSKFVLSGIKTALMNESNTKAIEIFRSAIDAATIPTDYEKDVRDIFVEICKNSVVPEDAYAMNGALFNLELNDPKYLLECYPACLALGNIVSFNDLGFNPSFHPVVKRFGRDVDVYAFARAIELLQQWGRKISVDFYKFISSHNPFPPRILIPKNSLPYLEEQFGFAYAKGKTTYDNPLDHADRVSKLPTAKKFDFKDIRESIINMLPKNPDRPYGP